MALIIAITTPVSAQIVAIETGKIEGKTLASGVRNWLGVPFAAPPIRDLRWKAPQPAANWGGVYHADRAAPMCMQAVRARKMNHYFGHEAIGEDCLYLNIWAPPAGEKHPVVVWIYGGGFTVGSANMANYSGEGLAVKGVVRVNIAYRVGPFGFFAHPELSKENGGHSGNYGLMDQVAGLQWIKQNIAAFGGDPNNVTIVGQSAGSMSVALLQQSPAAKGLFHKVVGMSGSPFGDLLSPTPLARAEAQGVALQKALGADSIDAMRDLAADRIAATARTVPNDPITIDGVMLNREPQALFAAGRQSDVPVMLGFTRDEAFRSLGNPKTVADYAAAVRTAFPSDADAILKAYPVKSEADIFRAVTDLQRDSSVGKQMAGWANAQKQFGKAPIFAWFFTRRQPYIAGISFSDHDPATVGAYHTGDVPYWLSSLDSLNLFRTTRDWTVEDRALAEAMSDMLIAFARTGVPAAGWPAFDPKRPRLMQLDLERRVTDWPNYKALGLLNAVPTPKPAPSSRIRD